MKDMILPFEIYTSSPEQTEEVGRDLYRAISEGELSPFVAMYGDLGVGKTAFVRGFCSLPCPSVTVKSPTFALVNDYKCSCGKYSNIYHFDMYRITSEDDLYSIGFYDYPESNCLCIIEWSEQIPYALPDEYIEVKIEKTDCGDGRRISVQQKKWSE